MSSSFHLFSFPPSQRVQWAKMSWSREKCSVNWADSRGTILPLGLINIFNYFFTFKSDFTTRRTAIFGRKKEYPAFNFFKFLYFFSTPKFFLWRFRCMPWNTGFFYYYYYLTHHVFVSLILSRQIPGIWWRKHGVWSDNQISQTAREFLSLNSKLQMPYSIFPLLNIKITSLTQLKGIRLWVLCL